MPCAEFVESLPELLNGTLPEARRAEVESHLAACEVCRLEWNDTRLAAAVLTTHVPAGVVTALAWDGPIEGFDTEVARRHVDECPECAEDLALARASRQNATMLAVEERAPSASWRLAVSLAAGLSVVAFLVGVLLGSREGRQRLAAERQEAAASRVQMSVEAERLRNAGADLRGRLARLEAPRVNLPLIELLSDSVRDPSAAGSEVALTIGPADTLAALVFSLPTVRQPVAAELHGGEGRTLWAGSGLRPGPMGSYVLGVPTELLPDGRVELVVRTADGGALLGRFSFRVRRPR